MNITDFQELIWDKGRELYRPMPWRQDTQPYCVLVSELMLQQTQVERVIPKFKAFIAAYPTVQALAQAPLAEVLVFWSGLGYNRRAKYVWQAAQRVCQEYGGVIPNTRAELQTLAGVGPNTAGAVLAYSFDQPVVFIETNIRTVFMYHFFRDKADVTDAQLAELVTATLDTEHPRQWYWAIMDYGAYLKHNGVRTNAQSHHYAPQSPLAGSIRQVRGQIVRSLTQAPDHRLSLSKLKQHINADSRFAPALRGLMRDSMVIKIGSSVQLVH